MFKLVRQILGSAAVFGAVFLPQAHAGLASTVIDFEGGALTGLYIPGDPDFGSFTHSDFVLAPTFDFGTIDTVALGLDPAVAPTGNDTQVYFNSNEGGLALARQDGGKFNLDGFSAAFVPQPDATGTIVVVAYAWFADSTHGGLYFGLGSPNTTGNYPFMTYSNPLDFDNFVDVIQVEFFACVLDTAVCGTPSRNNAQFALDNIHVSTFTQDGGGNDNGTVPEPGTLALFSLGLLGLGLRNRRRS